MKRFLSIFLTLMLMASLCISVSAADAPFICYEFYDAPEETAFGETISVPVYLTVEDTDVSSVLMHLSFDETAFAFEGYKTSTDKGEHNLNLGVVGLTENDSSVVSGVFVASDGTATSEFDETLLCNLRFTVLEDAQPGEYDFEIVKSQVQGTFNNAEALFTDFSLFDVLTVNVDTKDNYAFATTLILTGSEGAYESGELRALSTNGEWDTYELAETFLFDGEEVTLAEFEVKMSEFAYNNEYFWRDGYTEIYLNDMIIFKQDLSGKVKEIFEETEKMYYNVRKGYSRTYYEDKRSYGVFSIDDATVIFNCTADIQEDVACNEEDVFVTDISVLTHGREYTDVDICYDDTDTARIMFGKFGTGLTLSDPIFVVTDVFETTYEGENMTAVEGYSQDGFKTYYYSESAGSKIFMRRVPDIDSSNYDESYMIISDNETEAQKNDILIVNAKENGVIREAVKLCRMDEFASADSFVVSERIELCGIEYGYPGMFIQGYVAAVNGAYIYLANDIEMLGSDDVENMMRIESVSTSKFVVADYSENNETGVATEEDVVPGSMLYAKVNASDDIYEGIIVKNNHTAEVLENMPSDTEHGYTVGFATGLFMTGPDGAYESAVLEVLLPSNEWQSYDLAEQVMFNDTLIAVHETDFRSMFEAADLCANGSSVKEKYELVFNQLVYFTTDEDGKVDSIVYGIENINQIEKAKEYDAVYDGELYGFYTLKDDTAVYICNGIVREKAADRSNIKVTDISVLNKDEMYTGINIYGVSLENHTVGIMVGDFEWSVDFESPFFVVENILDMTLMDYGDVIQIIGMCEGEEQILYYSPEQGSVICGVTEVDGYAVLSDEEIVPAHGDVLVVNADAEGVIRIAAKIWNVNDFSDEDYFTMPDTIDGFKVDGKDKGRFVTGFVSDCPNGRWAYLTLDLEDFDTDYTGHSVYVRNADITVYDFTARKSNRINIGNCNDVEPGTMLLARVDEDDRVKDAVVIWNHATDESGNFVYVPATGVILDKQEITLTEGAEEYIRASFLPSNASNKSVKWQSSDESVATVSAGNVTAVGKGTATITATTEDGGYTAACKVTVKEKSPIADIATLRCYGASWSDEKKTISVNVDRFPAVNTSASLGVAIIPAEGYSVSYEFNGNNSSGGTASEFSNTSTSKYTLLSTGVNTESSGGGALGEVPMKIITKADATRFYVDVTLSDGENSVTYKMTVALRDPAVEGDVDISEIKPLRADPESVVLDNEAKTVYYETLPGASSAGFAVSVDNDFTKATRPRRLLTAKSGMSLAHGDIKTAEKDTFDRYVVARRSKGATQTYQVKVHGGEDGLTYTWYTVTVVFK